MAKCPDDSTGNAGFCTFREAPYGKVKASESELIGLPEDEVPRPEEQRGMPYARSHEGRGV
eukprot:scaffold229295_cov32-Tisochrysis_lutea.AAC.1